MVLLGNDDYDYLAHTSKYVPQEYLLMTQWKYNTTH